MKTANAAINDDDWCRRIHPTDTSINNGLLSTKTANAAIKDNKQSCGLHPTTAPIDD